MSIAALTTVFTPAPSCLAPTNIWQIYASCPLVGFNCYYLIQGPPSQSNCFPGGYEPTSTAYYSPGICPQGYTPACSQANPTGSVTVTTQTCCPRFVLLFLETWLHRSFLDTASDFSRARPVRKPYSLGSPLCFVFPGSRLLTPLLLFLPKADPFRRGLM
jgi:hypothetical protein